MSQITNSKEYQTVNFADLALVGKLAGVLKHRPAPRSAIPTFDRLGYGDVPLLVERIIK